MNPLCYYRECTIDGISNVGAEDVDGACNADVEDIGGTSKLTEDVNVGSNGRSNCGTGMLP